MAAISTLATLKTAILNWTKRSNLSAYLDEIIQMGEVYALRFVRSADMETSFSGSISSGTLAVPDSYLELKWAKIDGGSNAYLEMRPTQFIFQRYPVRSASGPPKFIGRDGSVFQFGPFPDDSYSITGYYYKKPASILAGETTFFLANPDLYLYCALCETETFIKNDKRMDLWKAKRDQTIAAINGLMREGQYGDGMEIKVA